MFHLTDRVDTGTALSDFQVAPEPRRGEPVTDWEMELALARSGAGRGAGRIKGHLADLPDFHRDYPAIIELCARELRNTLFRMSLDFGRLCPREGEFDEDLMARYVGMLACCRLHGIKPVVTIHHWPMPLSFCDYQGDAIIRGGWEHPAILDHFRFYVGNVVQRLFNRDAIRDSLEHSGDVPGDAIERIVEGGPLCTRFVTINEPLHHFVTPYVLGIFPPFKRWHIRTGYRVLARVASAHEIAFAALKDAAAQAGTEVRAGVAHSLTHVEGASILTRPVARLLDHYANWDIADRFERTENDFVGIQYYFRKIISLGGAVSGERHFGDHPEFGDIYPEGMKRLLLDVAARYPGREVLVTEFGFADRRDRRRPFWILDTVRKVLEAQADGAPVTGIILWTIINNLEWAEGMGVQFGLYDHFGRPLPVPDGGHLSSREVWAAASAYLHSPSEAGRRELCDLYARAERQFQNEIGCG